MGTRYQWRSVEIITSTAESLKRATEQLTQVAMEMQQHGLTEALFAWTQHQWNCLDVVITMASQCQAALPAQILAKQQGRLSQYENTQRKSARDVATRQARRAAAGTKPVPARPRGRPRKDAT